MILSMILLLVVPDDTADDDADTRARDGKREQCMYEYTWGAGAGGTNAATTLHVSITSVAATVKTWAGDLLLGIGARLPVRVESVREKDEATWWLATGAAAASDWRLATGRGHENESSRVSRVSRVIDHVLGTRQGCDGMRGARHGDSKTSQ